MFEVFESKFIRDDVAYDSGSGHGRPLPKQLTLQHFLDHYGGASFNNGIYRVVSPETAMAAMEFIREAYPHLKDRLSCFGFDWIGSLFCLDSDRVEGGEMGVLLLEPGTGKELKIPSNLASFHNEMLIKHEEAALNATFFKSWLTSGGQAPRIDQCIGYKKPLFFGGADTVENLELTDLDVYWTISGQLIRKVRGLPIGTKIGKVSLS